jgi:hypothetical protein
MASSRKKVVVRRFLPGLLWGYLPSTGIVTANGTPQLDLLDLGGHVHPLPLQDVKYVAYVRDFNTADTSSPERLQRKTFVGRPRTEGLWMRLTLRDKDVLEGLAALDLSLADAFAGDLGVHLLPPDIRGNTQRLYVPRSAMESLDLLAVVTNPSRKKPPADAKAAPPEAQPDLFPFDIPSNTRPQ